MRQKRIMLINDVTGFSKCAVACQLPIISAMGIEACFTPTAILSVNTYHKEFFFDDYTRHMKDYIQSYKDMNVSFDGIVTGFLGSADQIDIVKDFFESFTTEDNFILVDPVMGDHGKLYATYTQEMRNKMKELLPYASIVTPNLTELCALIDEEYPSSDISEKQLEKMCKKLTIMGPNNIVVTGISIGNRIINYVYQGNIGGTLVTVDRIGKDRSGTGDLISAIIAGQYLKTKDFKYSVIKATEFASKCIKYSQEIGADNYLGLCFEPFLKELGE